MIYQVQEPLFQPTTGLKGPMVLTLLILLYALVLSAKTYKTPKISSPYVWS